MDESPTIKRRTLLWLGVSALIAPVIPGLLHRTAASATKDELLGEIIWVGVAYLKKVPEEATRETLLALLPKLEGSKPLASRIRELEDRVAQDFAENRTVLLEGWLLSRTEARAAALLTLGVEQ